DKVGRGLDTVRRGWDDLAGTRRRQLERQLDRVGELRSRREGGDACGDEDGDGVVELAEPWSAEAVSTRAS
ncbi:MAG TPA: hypothetical protein VE575_06460, partial [Acidimicrobiales bacterium]|nr:hypothetical protein [Acidimicrobiales bacterium]